MASATSNTKDCFRVFVGQRVIGVLFSALPVGRSDLSSGTKTLVFEDGSGLTIASNGSFWTDSKSEIDRAVSEYQRQLDWLIADTKDIIALSGAHPGKSSGLDRERGL